MNIGTNLSNFYVCYIRWNVLDVVGEVHSERVGVFYGIRY